MPYFCRFALFTVVIVVLLIRLEGAVHSDRLGILNRDSGIRQCRAALDRRMLSELGGSQNDGVTE